LRFSVLIQLGAQGHTAAEATRALSSGPLSSGDVDPGPEHRAAHYTRTATRVVKRPSATGRRAFGASAAW